MGELPGSTIVTRVDLELLGERQPTSRPRPRNPSGSGVLFSG